MPPGGLRALLEAELPDRLLEELKQVGPVERPQGMAKSWRRIVEASGERGLDEQPMAARVDRVLDYIHVSDVFERTSTLSDVLPKEDVEALFRLGQYLVYLRPGL